MSWELREKSYHISNKNHLLVQHVVEDFQQRRWKETSLWRKVPDSTNGGITLYVRLHFLEEIENLEQIAPRLDYIHRHFSFLNFLRGAFLPHSSMWDYKNVPWSSPVTLEISVILTSLSSLFSFFFHSLQKHRAVGKKSHSLKKSSPISPLDS